MANHDPKPTPPEKPVERMIPIKRLEFITGSMPVPGKPSAIASVSASAPSAGGFYQIGFDPRAQRFRVMFFAPNGDLERAPSEIRDYPAAICMSVPA